MKAIICIALAVVCFLCVRLINRYERRRKSATCINSTPEYVAEPTTVRIHATELMRIYEYYMYLPDYIRDAANECLTGNKYEDAELPMSYYDDVENAKKEYENAKIRQQAWEADYQKISEHRLAGMEKEKSADNEGAISEYAVAIILGEQSKFNLFHAYSYAYERIIVCLRKAKRLDKEVNYIERYLKYDLSEAARSKYSTRLEKLKSKIQQ